MTIQDDEGGPAAAGEQGTYWAGRRSVGQGATCSFVARRFNTLYKNIAHAGSTIPDWCSKF